MIASQRAATTMLTSIQRQLNTLVSNLPSTPVEVKPSVQAQIDVLKTQESVALRAIQAANVALGLGTGGAAEGAGLGGGQGESTGDPELDKLLQQY